MRRVIAANFAVDDAMVAGLQGFVKARAERDASQFERQASTLTSSSSAPMIRYEIDVRPVRRYRGGRDLGEGSAGAICPTLFREAEKLLRATPARRRLPQT